MSILYIYITIFTIYFFILSLAGIKPEKKIRDKYTPKDLNICVVVYATGESPMLENLINQLKNQSYASDRYLIYVILDKVENPPQMLFQADLNINVININNIEPIGKSQAYSILAEKLSEVKEIDSYVFIEGKHYVDYDFLSNINFYLTKENAFMPAINYIEPYEDLKFWDCVKIIYANYIYKFLYRARTRLGLTNLLNTDAFVIRKSVLDKIGIFDFKDKTSEVKYTLRLANEGIKTSLASDVKVYTSIENFDTRIPSLSKRLGIFRDNITKYKSFVSFEYLWSLLLPNWLVCILIYAALLYHSYHFPLFVVNFSIILIGAILLMLAFCMSLFNANIYAKEYLYLFSYPLYSIFHLIKNFPPVRGIRNFIANKNRKHVIEKVAVDVIVTDGKNDYKCQLELISDDGLARVKFINKNKTYTTKNNHLRMVDALRELIQKLDDYGLSLKICQSCKYFQPVIDGSTNMVKGVCNCRFEGRVKGDILATLIWNTCSNYEKQNVISLFD